MFSASILFIIESATKTIITKNFIVLSPIKMKPILFFIFGRINNRMSEQIKLKKKFIR